MNETIWRNIRLAIAALNESEAEVRTSKELTEEEKELYRKAWEETYELYRYSHKKRGSN